MENSTMTNMLVAMDIASDSWISTDRIHTINLTTDGNHYHNYYEQLLYFDTAGIIKVKYYNYGLAATKFYNAVAVDLRNFEIKHNFLTYYGLDEVKTLLKFRNPKYGDIAFTIDSAGAFVAAANITAISPQTMTVDADLDLTGNRLCYADGSLLVISGGIIIPKRAGSFIEGLKDESQILYREPKTIYTADEYLFIDNVNGMSLNRY